MLILNKKEKGFIDIKSTEMKSEQLMERYDLQEAIVNSWELFKNEIDTPSLFLIGTEIKPHISILNSIDILAYDPDDSTLVVVELKRDRNKYQLLQSLSYAAMISNWTSEDVIQELTKDLTPDYEELVDLLHDNELATDIKIILIAESYDPEVIITADWLTSNYSLDITAITIALHKTNDDTFILFDQIYPLKGLSDVYKDRARKNKSNKNIPEIEWEDVIPKLSYDFAQKGIELCRNIKPGHPNRREFRAIKSNYDGFDMISLYFREKYMNVYIRGIHDDAGDFLKSKFTEPITVNTWKYGYNFRVSTNSQFEDLVKWLNLE